MIENTTAIKFRKDDIVRPVGQTKSVKKGIVIGYVPPIGTGGEHSYCVYWYGVGEGCGWRDCDLQSA